MANFRRGESAAKAATKRGGGTFTPTFGWKDEGDEHFLQFLTSADDVLTILYHKFIIVGENEKGLIYRDFVSPTDPAFEGEGGSDPLIERFGVMPKPHNAALAVALEPVREGRKIVDFKVKYREFERGGETVTVPDVRLVLQSVYVSLFPNLFSFAEVKGPIEDYVLHIKQSGKGKDKNLAIWDVGAAIDLDLDPEDVFDYEAHFTELASPERFAEFIDPLPDDAVVVREWGAKPTKASTPRRTQTATSSSTSAKEEVKPVRSERFARLKQQVE